MTPREERDVIRRLAERWMELASLPVMAERKRLWTALKDLRAERPMILFETWTLLGYIDESELVCEDPHLRGIERSMKWTIRQAEEVGDDIVIEPCWRTGWHVGGTGYGVDIPSVHAVDSEGGSVGYAYDHPIKTPADIDRLTPRSWHVDREASERGRVRMAELFGDILPVTLHGTTGLHAGLTGDLFRLIGNNNLLFWVHDEPDAIHRVMAYLRDDRLRYLTFLETEGLLGSNNNWTFVGSGSPGYTTALPPPGPAGSHKLRDLWMWMESQETTAISPAMFGEFFLPYMADVSRPLGLIYYGCCEPVHDRWSRIIEAIPHVRAVSVSPWCDMPAIAGMLGKDVVFSRKPRPAPISGTAADWDALREDLAATFDAAKECNLEIIFRDVYRIGGDRSRLAGWVEMARSMIGM